MICLAFSAKFRWARISFQGGIEISYSSLFDKKNTISNVWTAAHYRCYISKMIVTLEAFMVWKHTIKRKMQSKLAKDDIFPGKGVLHFWTQFIENFLLKSILSYPITLLKTSRQQHFARAHKSGKEEIPICALASKIFSVDVEWENLLLTILFQMKLYKIDDW